MDQFACPHCGQSHRKGARFCPVTGQPIYQTCPQCSQRVEPGWKVCVYCGNALVSGMEHVPEKRQARTPTSSKRETRVWILVGLAVLSVSSVFAVGFYRVLLGEFPFEDRLNEIPVSIGLISATPTDEIVWEETVVEEETGDQDFGITGTADPDHIPSETRQPSDTPHPTDTPTPVSTPTRTSEPTATATEQPPEPSGKIVFTCQIFRDAERDQICLINTDGSGYRRLTRDDNALHFYSSLAPDGNSVVFSSNRSGRLEIYEMDLNGNFWQVTRGLERVFAPSVSPDGRQIVITHQIGGFQEIWIMNRDGSNPQQVYGRPQGEGWDPVWSPDGNQIMFAGGSPGNVQIYTINKDGSNLRQVTSMEELRGRSDWSPDGNTIATYAGRPWLREIYLLDFDGNVLSQLTSGGNNLAPSFSPDGGWIAFTSYMDNYGDDHGCEVYIMRIDGSDIRRLTNNNYCDWQPRWGP
jgi:TolB protein